MTACTSTQGAICPIRRIEESRRVLSRLINDISAWFASWGRLPAGPYHKTRLAVLEAGSNWITAWLDRLDHKFEILRPFSSLQLLPSEYFKRQCVISAEPDESLTASIVEHLGADYVIWASDYPHLDASFHVVDSLRERIGRLPEDAQRKVLGTNALRFYGLEA